jgi:Domain of unknown function (DUF397)
VTAHIPNSDAACFDWFKSSYSSGDQSCVEIAHMPGAVPVRDSKDRRGAALVFTHEAWGAFVGALKAGQSHLQG